MEAAIYLHSDRESNYMIGEGLGLTGEALTMFSFACYEVRILVEVDEATGDTQIVEVDGRKLVSE